MPTPTQEEVAALAGKLRWSGMELALRRQMIEEGHLPPSALWEDVKDDPTSTVELCTDEEFNRAFTEDALGIALNVGNRGQIIVKRCVPGSPSASRRIPPVSYTHLTLPTICSV